MNVPRLADWQLALAIVLVAHPGLPAEDAGTDMQPATEASQGRSETLEVIEGMSLSLKPPLEWSTSPSTDTSSINLRDLPGARIVLARSWRPAPLPSTDGPGAYPDRMMLACVQWTAGEWTSGVETLIFERMSAAAKVDLSRGFRVDGFEPGQAEELAKHYRQPFKARGERAPPRAPDPMRPLIEDRPDYPHIRMRAVGVHVLTMPMTGAPSMVACSLTCAEDELPDPRSLLCDSAVSSLTLQGNIATEPSKSLVRRFLLGVRLHPLGLVGMLVGGLLVIAGAALVVHETVLAGRRKPTSL